MSRFASAALWLLGLGAAVGGLYFGALSTDLLTWFWVIVSLSLVGGLVFAVAPWLRERWKRLVEFPHQATRLAEAEAKVAGLREEIAGVKASLYAATAEAEAEGARKVIGASLALKGPRSPRLLSVGLNQDDAVGLVCDVGDGGVMARARYEVVSDHFGRVLGVVEVVKVNSKEKTALLECVERTDPDFWQDMESRARTSSSEPLPTVHLERYSISTPLEMAEGRPRRDADTSLSNGSLESPLSEESSA